ncbi:FAD-dependent oxidoreductase [Kribbella koreensis]|uniref:FAD-dependent oxidoreductase n=2 Tax=Kribbella koreensis TaxID=57909 RepID=A0ABN1PH22_9ACTN
MPRYDALQGDTTVDVLVIGGGLIGLTTALLLARDGAQVALIEAQRIGSRTSGHTTGKVTSQHGAIYATLVARHGTAKARQYATANQAAVEQVAALIDAEGIDCEFLRTPAYVYSTKSADALDSEAAAASSLGLPAHLVDAAEVGVPAAAALRFDNQVQLHPVRYLAGLATAFERTGGRIFEHTRAVKVDEKDGAVHVSTEKGGVITAYQAVLATLLPIGITGAYFARTRPKQSHGIAVRLPVEAPTGMAISVDSPTHSTRPWPGGGPNGLIVVGSDHEVGSTNETGAAYQSLVDWVNSTWNAAIEPEYRWSAHDYSTPDLLPYVGRSPGSRSIFVATGMHKWGLSNGTVAAGIINDLIAGRDHPAADLYDATRFGDTRAVAKLITDNLKVGKNFTLGHAQRILRGGLDHLEAGQGGLLKTGNGTIGGYRDQDGNLHTIKPICTHLGCPLTWNTADTTWDCSCHGSRFDPDGEILDGPATTPLEAPTTDA